MSLKFGLYAELQTPPDKPHAELYREIMRKMEHADQVGSTSTPSFEHHFFQEFSTSANPLAMICAAPRARTARFRVACTPCPCATPCASRARSRRRTSSAAAASRRLGRGQPGCSKRSGVDSARERVDSGPWSPARLPEDHGSSSFRGGQVHAAALEQPGVAAPQTRLEAAAADDVRRRDLAREGHGVAQGQGVQGDAGSRAAACAGAGADHGSERVGRRGEFLEEVVLDEGVASKPTWSACSICA